MIRAVPAEGELYALCAGEIEGEVADCALGSKASAAEGLCVKMAVELGLRGVSVEV